MPSPPHSPLSPATSLLSALFLPWRLAAVACNNFSHRFYLSLHPAGAIADCFHVSPLLSGVTFSCKIAHIRLSCPLAPLCSLYIASYLNSQLFSWLNKPRTSYSKVIRALLESYIATWLFWYPFTSSLPADKGLEFLYIYIYMWEFTLSLGRNPLYDLCSQTVPSAGGVLCITWLSFVSALTRWQKKGSE